jgi:hypothetical protein
MQPLSLQQVADRAGVGQEFVRRLIELGALGSDEDGYGERDVHLVALLHVWEWHHDQDGTRGRSNVHGILQQGRQHRVG